MYPSQLGVSLLDKVPAPGRAALLWALPNRAVLLAGKAVKSSHFLKSLETSKHIKSRCVAFPRGGMVLE